MSRPKHYVPAIRKPIVSALYHEAQQRQIPMTHLVNELLEKALAGSPGLAKALGLDQAQTEPA